MNQPDILAFTFFDKVWLTIDEDGSSPGVGQIIGVLYKPTCHMYQVQWGWDKAAYHYAEELTKTKPTEYSTHGT